MKRPLALTGLLAVALWTASCTDQPMAPEQAPLPQMGVQAAPAATLYAGTSNPGVVYGYDGSSWTALSGTLGWSVLDVIKFDGQLYASGMSSRFGSPGKIWRYDGEGGWTEIAALDQQVSDLEIWNGDLYAGTSWNGGRLYRYNSTTDAFDYLGAVGPYDSGGYYHPWRGIRAMYPWEETGHLHLGDIGYDVLGRWDGTSLINDAYMGGSCIYDLAPFNGRLYAAAYYGRLLWSDTGIGRTWSDMRLGRYYLWEIEPFQGALFVGDAGGHVISLDASHAQTQEWSSGAPPYAQQVTAMTTHGDAVLYFGTGGEAGYRRDLSGVAGVYSFDGATATKIFDADGGDTGGTDHAGIQVLYTPGQLDPLTKDDCKKGGWELYGFRNQGQCVRFIETGKDSR